MGRNCQETGYDPEYFISLADAFTLVSNMKKAAKPRTVRKFLIGAAMHGSQSGLEVFAEKYQESYTRIDRNCSQFTHTEYQARIPTDFWRICMAIEPEAPACFYHSNLAHISQMTMSELPYRMRDPSGGELQNEQVELFQMATDVHLAKKSLIELAKDGQWQHWGAIDKALARGRRPKWQWDKVIIALTREAASNPTILDEGVGPIVDFMKHEFEGLNDGGRPDDADMYYYARKLAVTYSEPEGGAPA